MRKKELIQQLAQSEERAGKFEARIALLEGQLAEYRARERDIVTALARAEEKTAAMADEATANAARIVKDAEREAAMRLYEADAAAKETLDAAKRDSAQLLSQAEATVAEYEETIAAYNAALDRAAAEAAANAERFAAFSKQSRVQPSGLAAEAQGLRELPYAEPIELPDAGDSPAKLMQNIYRIQNRVPPEPNDLAPLFGSIAPARANEAAPVNAAEVAPVNVNETAAEEAEDDVPMLDTLLDTTETNAQDASLDDLLEEIIKAGEQKYGEEQ